MSRIRSHRGVRPRLSGAALKLILSLGALAVMLGLLLVIVDGPSAREQSPDDGGTRRAERGAAETELDGQGTGDIVLISTGDDSGAGLDMLTDTRDATPNESTLLERAAFPEFPNESSATSSDELEVIGDEGLTASK